MSPFFETKASRREVDRASGGPRLRWSLRRLGSAYLLAVALIVAGVLLVAAGGQQVLTAPRPILRVGTNLWIGYQPIQLARSAGLLSDRTLLLEGRSTSSVIEALRLGTIDAAMLTLDEALRAADEGTPLTAVLALDVSNGADVVLARDPEIASTDAKGKRVGVETGAVGAYLLHRYLKANDLAPSDVTIVDIPPALHHLAFERFDVDFLVTYEPFASAEFARAAIRVFDSSKIPGEIVDVLVVRTDRLHLHVPELESLLDAWFAGLRIIRATRGEHTERIARHLDLSADEVGRILRRLEFPERAEMHRFFKQGGLREASHWIAEWLRSENAIKGDRFNLDFSDSILERGR